ncbi:MAG: phage portal protein, partial [Actinomycetota bacterium]|nr:phage portal protein [Actinomycetota bacterium]
IGPGESEIRKVIPLQDAINKQVADMMVASEFTAFRQRYVTGMDIPKDAQGNQVEPFVMSADRLFIAENPVAKFGEFSETNLAAYVKSVEMLVQHVASQTRTPPHYFYMSGNFPSGESIKSAETGLVAKCRSKQLYFGEAWEEVIRLAFMVLDDPRSKVTDTETIWRDCESSSEGEHIDASLKKLAAGVPQRQVWEDMGYTQVQIERFKQMRAEEAAEAAALAIGLTPFTSQSSEPGSNLDPGGTVVGTASRPTEDIQVPGSPLPMTVTAARERL